MDVPTHDENGRAYTAKEIKKLKKQKRKEAAIAKRNSDKQSTKSASSARNPQVKRKNSKEKSQRNVFASLAYDDPKKIAKFKKKGKIARLEVSQAKKVELFQHLPQYKRHIISVKQHIGKIHPAILNLGLKYNEGTITGANARAHGMLTAIRAMITDWKPDEQLGKRRTADQLIRALNDAYRLLIDCRDPSISMGNAYKWLKGTIINIDSKNPNISWALLSRHIINELDTYARDRIEFALKVIMASAADRIKDGDVILTYARSFCVEEALLTAHSQQKKFRVIVVDSRPRHEGKKLMKRLVCAGLSVTYCLLNAIGSVVKEANMVFLGAASILSNGSLFSRVGTSMIAITARHFNIPVLVLCETYKFSERIKIDSICYNSLGDPDDLVCAEKIYKEWGNDLSDWQNIGNLKILNLNYDVTPPSNISMVITEMGAIPSTSVPVIIREFNTNRL